MNLSLFNSHSLAGRLEIVWAHGALLAHRGRRGYHIEIYDMGSFFAGVWSNPQTDFISLVRGLDSRRALEPYVTSINLLEMTQSIF
ncbi:hypothetical protein MKJ04_20020 [Pontibacter sp. E15-1]|uniref:hypothetical protein n=1 Tax=Pontibacter sp. E15-1 TaxID=2919918 RepID=UPI001F5039D4|nr:hypothetical protein [Pontibacter sp. E15-1]MCJ8167138.1 hypothetical protein [Pontibacter sp. E15-1]